MGKEKTDSGMPESKKGAAIYVLIAAFEFHDQEETLFKVLDGFSYVYGGDIPGWLQCLYDYLGKSGNNVAKLDAIRKFAEERKMEIID